MDISKIAKLVQHTLTENSPAILTGMAVAGVITTTIMAVRATPKAMESISIEQRRRGKEVKGTGFEGEAVFDYPKLSNWDTFKTAWKAYIPTSIFGVSTIACVVGANTVSSRKTAALMSVYTVTKTALDEYQAKVVETIGDKAEQKVRDGVAKDRIEKNPPPKQSGEVQILGAGEMLCYDSLSGRYFKCDMETIRKAQNDINSEVLNNMYAPQNDFYQLVGLEGNVYGETAGWNTEHMMDLVFSTHLSEDGRPCLSIDYRNPPVLDYYKLH